MNARDEQQEEYAVARQKELEDLKQRPPDEPDVDEALARLTKVASAGALPADEADDIRTLLAYAEGRPDAIVTAYELGYRAGVHDCGREVVEQQEADR